MKVTYRKVSKGSYVGDTTDYHIEIDKIEEASGYLDWHIFVSHKLDGQIIGDRRVIGQTYAHTLREGKIEAQALLTIYEAEQLLSA
ncbi:hypothetical protein PBI_THONKO_108 [Mycobacterium phage Thonko]|uniref:Uncharacterized protein n=1 Tax=Mycobacterium phage Thonko TaxID=2282910 RepID=A0A346FCF3_9CAUD|nr:hypothetical protein I5G57_gp108 [Mycobacterium phage Thonko]AXN53378.1 hypothetical protein PBI_THONKO_108 [Mycobacterium phage Thonko]